MRYNTVHVEMWCGSFAQFHQFLTVHHVMIHTLESVASDSFMHVSRSQISECHPSPVFSGNRVFISQTYQGKKLLVLLYMTGYMQLHSIGWYLCAGP